MFVPAHQVTILDTWHTLGMRGTGSHDVEMTDVFVPSRHTALLAPYEKPGSAYTGPLYKFTAWAAITVLATPPLGIARAAIDDLLDSSSENRRQKEFNKREADVRRQADRRSAEWLCRRGGRRLRVCCRAGDGRWGDGGSGCWRVGRRAVCGRTERAGRPVPLLR